MSDYDKPVENVDGGRKARKKPNAVGRKKKYLDDSQEPNISCNHGLSGEGGDSKHKRSLCRMADLTHNDIVNFRKRFYSNKSKTLQDNYILKYIKTKKPVRRTVQNPKNQRTMTITYYIQNEQHEDVPVCAATFRSILSISRDRIQRLAKNYSHSGECKIFLSFMVGK